MLTKEFKQTILAILDNMHYFKPSIEKDFKDETFLQEFKKDSAVLDIRLEPNTGFNTTSNKLKVTLKFEKIFD